MSSHAFESSRIIPAVYLCAFLSRLCERVEGRYHHPPLPLNTTVSSLISHSWKEDLRCTDTFTGPDGALFWGVCMCMCVCTCMSTWMHMYMFGQSWAASRVHTRTYTQTFLFALLLLLSLSLFFFSLPLSAKVIGVPRSLRLCRGVYVGRDPPRSIALYRIRQETEWPEPGQSLAIAEYGWGVCLCVGNCGHGTLGSPHKSKRAPFLHQYLKAILSPHPQVAWT